ncbi:hypothetical protein HMI55_001014 [Coelomomyces lativittatus]|nr:hypothetical protein HMI55_001014 [Coelomomyces lativittatus]
MMYTIFVVFDDQTTPVRAIDLHSGMSLLARRVDIRIVSIDELLVSFFSRGLETSTTFELSEWVHNETKEKFLKLCRYQRQRNGIIPDRTFEHILSYLQLLPFLQNVAFSLVEIERVFELSIVSLTTLIGHIKHDKLKASHLIDLLNRLFSACLAITIFNQDQTLYLESLYKEHLQNLNALLEPVNPPINSSNSNLFFPHSKNDFMTINENNTTSNLLTTSTSPDSLPSFSFFARSSPENLIPRSPTKLKSAQRSRNYITLDIGLFHYDFDPLDVLGKFLWEALQ